MTTKENIEAACKRLETNSLAMGLCGQIANHCHCYRCDDERAVIDAAREVQDWRDSAREVLAEKCAPDERHCSCVPVLRRELTAERAKREQALSEVEAIEKFARQTDRTAQEQRVYALMRCKFIRAALGATMSSDTKTTDAIARAAERCAEHAVPAKAGRRHLVNALAHILREELGDVDALRRERDAALTLIRCIASCDEDAHNVCACAEIAQEFIDGIGSAKP